MAEVSDADALRTLARMAQKSNPEAVKLLAKYQSDVRAYLELAAQIRAINAPSPRCSTSTIEL